MPGLSWDRTRKANSLHGLSRTRNRNDAFRLCDVMFPMRRCRIDSRSLHNLRRNRGFSFALLANQSIRVAGGSRRPRLPRSEQ